MALFLAVAAAAAIVSLFLSKPRSVRLPYHDSFAAHRAGEWVPYGGFWRIRGDTVINGSDAAGSKLITGSPDWSNYQVTASVRLLAHGGDIGVVLRVSDPGIGPNAYRGYYVGLRSDDASLVVGRANYSWLEDRPVFMGEAVQNGRWYRLHVVAVGCTLAVESTDLASGMHRYAAMQDDLRNCIRSGKAGLRSTDSSSAWKDVSISRASKADLDRILAFGPHLAHPDYPIREQDLFRMRSQYSPGSYPFLDVDQAAHALTQRSLAAVQTVPAATTLQVRTESLPAPEVRLHGVITSISPFYLQDATGGIRILPPDPGALCIGDEVDAIGHPSGTEGTIVFVAQTVQGPTERAALTTISISPAQAASGMYEGSLVEVTGRLVSRTTDPDGSTMLALHDDGQNFRARIRSDPFASAGQNFQSGSTLRVLGISTIAPGEQGSSFTLLVQSSADVTLLSGPSWLQGWRLLCLILVGLLTSCFGVYLLMHSSRARMHAIVEERERLSHEVHDTLAQSFAGISYRLQGLRKRARAGRLPPHVLAEELEEVYEVVAGTHREASAIVAALHPSAREEGDLLTLIERASANLLSKNGPAVRTQRNGEPYVLQPAVTDALFRVAMEALANVLRHSQATIVKLSMNFTPGLVTMMIEDNGVGFSPELAKSGFGLQTMEKRCTSIRASLAIVSEPGKGTRLSVSVPHGKAQGSLPCRSRPQQERGV